MEIMETALNVFNTLCQDPLWRHALLMVTDAKVPWKLLLVEDKSSHLIAVGILLMNTWTFVDVETQLELATSVLSITDLPDYNTMDGCYMLDIQTPLKNVLS